MGSKMEPTSGTSLRLTLRRRSDKKGALFAMAVFGSSEHFLDLCFLQTQLRKFAGAGGLYVGKLFRSALHNVVEGLRAVASDLGQMCVSSFEAHCPLAWCKRTKLKGSLLICLVRGYVARGTMGVRASTVGAHPVLRKLGELVVQLMVQALSPGPTNWLARFLGKFMPKGSR